MMVQEIEQARGRFENKRKKKKKTEQAMGHNTKAQKNITGL